MAEVPAATGIEELPHPASAPDTYAAVDLGSNSFHLLVARREHGELRVIDSIKEMVRLAGGLDEEGRLAPEVRDRALDCLARFGQRLRGIPNRNLRAVGTQSLRRMQRANAFLMVAETALGCPVDIIAGREEARLIYLGVSQGVSGHDDRRLVIDIGGGSTELVIGQGLEPLQTASLQVGCVSLTRWSFPNGQITPERWELAERSVRAEMQELQIRYRELGWVQAVGSSGTIKAVASMCQANSWCESAITPEGVVAVRDALLEAGHVDDIDIKGLSERRRPVIVGGVAILSALFASLGIEELRVSPYALREGVLHDLLGRLEHRDPRDKTVKAFRARHGVDLAQVARVRDVALAAFDQVAADLELREVHRDLLGWACELHECGLSVSHSGYQQHSAYLVDNSDMAGFSRQEQMFLAALMRCQRRAVPDNYASGLPPRLHPPLRGVLLCLRLAVILCRSRDDSALPALHLQAGDGDIELTCHEAWARSHPLTVFDLEIECDQLEPLGMSMELVLEGDR